MVLGRGKGNLHSSGGINSGNRRGKLVALLFRLLELFSAFFPPLDLHEHPGVVLVRVGHGVKEFPVVDLRRGWGG